jgi:hypothetical protein
MLDTTNPAVLRCLDKAAECDRRSREAKDTHAREMYRRLAENWRFVSENHQHIARMEAFVKAATERESEAQ